jgi:hypothetical protein
MVFVYVPNGIHMQDWTPGKTGRDFELPFLLEALKDFRQDLSVLTGLTCDKARPNGDGPGDHARAMSAFLTGRQPRKTPGANIKVGISIDQLAAQKLGDQTRFPSLEIGCEGGRQAGNCDSGYSCAYSNSISWRSPITPNPPEINPRLVFERLFGDFDASESPQDRARRRGYDRSILDSVQSDTQRLKADLGPTDRAKLEQYLEGVREIEKRILAAETDGDRPLPTMATPAGIPVEFADHLQIMFDLMAVALQTDSTRIITFMIGREGSNRTYPEIDVPDAHHGLTHHKNDETKIRKIQKINRYHVEHFAKFLDKLRSIEDGDGTLLDNSMVIYGSGLGDGNRHTHDDLPVLLAGRDRGSVRPGRHLAYQSGTPLNNLYVSLLDRVGVPAETLGDSTGKLADLSDI